MKLALMIFGPLDRRSGGYSYDCDLVTSLEQQGHSVALLSLPPSASPIRAWLSGQWGNQARTLASWRRRMASFDAVIFDELIFPAVVGALWRWKADRAQPVWIGLVHHLRQSEQNPPRLWHGWLQSLERRFLSLMDGFIYNSYDTQHAVVALMGPKTAPYHVANPPIHFRNRADFQQAKEHASVAFEGRIIFVANLITRKNLHGLLVALALILEHKPELSWQLEIIGDPTVNPRYVRRCRKLVQRLALTERVVFRGRLDDSRLAEAYLQADILAVPSFHEGWGMVYSEALANGVIPLGSWQGGAGEAIGSGGILVDPRDPADIARHLSAALEDADHRAGLLEKGVLRLEYLLKSPDSFPQVAAFLEDLSIWHYAKTPEQSGDKPAQTENSDFVRYLESKITVDDRSLHPRLLDALRVLPAAPAVLELGGGSGSMARRLAKTGLLPPDTRYLLVDAGAEQLELARRYGEGLFPGGWFRTELADLYQLLGRERRASVQYDLLIAHAVCDLFDPWTFSLALAGLKAHYYLLTHIFDGLTVWEPCIDPVLDHAIVRAYHDSMDERQHHGGEGSSHAGRDYLTVLPLAGLEIIDVAASDWIVRPDKQGKYPADEAWFLQCMLDFFENSLRGRPGLDAASLAWWLCRRRGQLARGELSLIVHQLDILAAGTQG